MSYFVIIRGPLGSGKTTIAKQLSEKIGAHYFNIDQTIDEHKLDSDREDGYISQKSFLRANEIIIPEIRNSLAQNIPAIIDGNFYWRSQIDDLVSNLPFQYHIFTLKAPLELCIERDSKRPKPHGEIAAQVVYAKTTEFDVGHIIDASQSIEKSTAEIKTFIDKSLFS